LLGNIILPQYGLEGVILNHRIGNIVFLLPFFSKLSNMCYLVANFLVFFHYLPLTGPMVATC
jgi:hypothetical protein